MYSLEFGKIYEKILYYQVLGIPQRQQKSLLSANFDLMYTLYPKIHQTAKQMESNIFILAKILVTALSCHDAPQIDRDQKSFNFILSLMLKKFVLNNTKFWQLQMNLNGLSHNAY